jgi:cobalt-zinc-cadmium efflux system membrane fusion protein
MMNLNPASVEEGNISSTINLYAPISGYITKVNVSNGSFVSSSDEIMEIVNTDHIHLELSLFEKDILKVKKGQQINFRVPEASNDTFKAEVHLVGTSVDETNRTIKVHGHIDDNETNSFVMGMFIDADILTDTKIGKALPKEAITEIDGDFFVMVLEETTKEGISFGKVKLENGKQNEEFVEVLNIADFADKQVLTKGSFMLLSE